MLVNRIRERLAAWRPRSRALARRAQGRVRRPLVLVPSILGTRLVDEAGRMVWGDTRRLTISPRPVQEAARSAGVLAGFTVIPGLYVHDVLGGLLRFLEDVGGYRRGHDLHVLDYDWRPGVAAAAHDLRALLDRLPGPADLLGMSTGGLVIRALLAREPRGVDRAIYLGTPQRGTFMALSSLVQGWTVVPGGKRFGWQELLGLQTVWDALPAPGEPVFVDERGHDLAHDLHDPRTWVALGLARRAGEVATPLAVAGTLRTLFDVPSQVRSFAIGARHRPTVCRCVITGGRATFPPYDPGRRPAPGAYQPGDGSVTEGSLGAGIAHLQFSLTTREHRQLPCDPTVHHLVLEALLA